VVAGVSFEIPSSAGVGGSLLSDFFRERRRDDSSPDEQTMIRGLGGRVEKGPRKPVYISNLDHSLDARDVKSVFYWRRDRGCETRDSKVCCAVDSTGIDLRFGGFALGHIAAMDILEAETVLGTLISKRLLIQTPPYGAESYVLAHANNSNDCNALARLATFVRRVTWPVV
jgi:hypothetical protein